MWIPRFLLNARSSVFQLQRRLGLAAGAEGRCWLCGARADSAEHRFKRSDLVRLYGTGPYSEQGGPVHGTFGKLTSPIRGPNAKRVKYEKSMCQHCNTTRSQPWDVAYEVFSTWVDAHAEELQRKRELCFDGVYGVTSAVSQRDLFRYFAKCFACRVADSGYEVPGDVIDVMVLDRFWTKLRLVLAVDERVTKLLGHGSRSYLSNGELGARVLRFRPWIARSFWWDQHLGWLMISYWCGERPPMKGSIWIANALTLSLATVK